MLSAHAGVGKALANTLNLTVNGRLVEVADEGASLMDVLRSQLGICSVKDGCSPQGQCGCCTVWVDDKPRVSCVTPARRVAERAITTLEGLPQAERDSWARSFCASGASQCGFCTPGIIMRLAGLHANTAKTASTAKVQAALAAHLCRCTGWQTIAEAWEMFERTTMQRNWPAATLRAEIEGGSAQLVGPKVALGEGGFADDTAPEDALVALLDSNQNWVVGETLEEARRLAKRVQGRRTPAQQQMPLEFPEGDWAVRLRTSWVEPAYLETDASWCVPGGKPANPLANGGAFGGKVASPLPEVAKRLANKHGRTVRVLWVREDTVRFGPKRPPVALGIAHDSSGIMRVVRTPGVASCVKQVAPNLEVQEVAVVGPPTSCELRGAGWAEAVIALSALQQNNAEPMWFTSPKGGQATAQWQNGKLQVKVRCGEPLDAVVLRSYCIGAAHMAYSWVTSEALCVDENGDTQNLTVRSFGIVPATKMPPVEVEVASSHGTPTNASDAVFVAVAAATWQASGYQPNWPTGPIEALQVLAS